MRLVHEMFNSALSLSVILLLLLAGPAYGGRSKIKMAEDYDINETPTEASGTPVKVNMFLYLQNIYSIDEPEQTVGLEMAFVMFWHDHRISLSANSTEYAILSRNPTENIWIPDLYILNAIQITHPRYILGLTLNTKSCGVY